MLWFYFARGPVPDRSKNREVLDSSTFGFYFLCRGCRGLPRGATPLLFLDSPKTSLALAGAVAAAPDVGLVERGVLICLGVILDCSASVGTRLLWVLGEVTAPIEKQFGLSVAYGKSDQAAGLQCVMVALPLFLAVLM